jgi:hypothetical protein
MYGMKRQGSIFGDRYLIIPAPFVENLLKRTEILSHVVTLESLSKIF